MSMWAQAYSKKGTNVAYQPIGSGGGVSQINAQTVDFGASDTPMLDTELAAAKGGPILHIPLVLGAVTIAYNVKGVGSGLNFDGPTIGKIYRRPDHQVERPGDQDAQSEGEPARRADRGRAPLGWLGHDGSLHGLPDEDEPGVGREAGRSRQVVRQDGCLAGRHRRQGQRRRRRSRQPDRGRHRLSRVAVRDLQQADVRQRQEQAAARSSRRASRRRAPPLSRRPSRPICAPA